ncbi:FtsX-like permease family protein [Streptomyces sp. NPDC087849]|uniref:ABC transporter permease n=1 Tax=Streptomyces sp. NPDC087849 TaxID=3365808 RepID=UPI00382C050D
MHGVREDPPHRSPLDLLAGDRAKALGFTPNQVVAVYLTMVSVPAIAGCVLGALLGTALAQPILSIVFSGIGTGSAVLTISPWVSVVSLADTPVVVLLAALIPALRAHRLPATRAITAGSAPRTGRGLRVQRKLGGTRLPRSVSLGLGQPFARPGRTLLTMAAIVLGVTTVTLTTGLTSTMVAYGDTAAGNGAAQVEVRAGSPANRETAPKLSDARTEELLRSLPGAEQLTANALVQVNLVGYTQLTSAFFFRGDPPPAASRIVQGRWPDGPGEAVVGPSFLKQHGLSVGDRITLATGGRKAAATIVGESMDGDARGLNASRQTLTELSPHRRAGVYAVTLAPGTDAKAYIKAVKAADPGLHPSLVESGSGATTAIVGFSSVFTVLRTVVAALGVFNTVLLSARERRRDLGMLKSIGMTPRQIVAMTVTSVAGLGVVSGLVGIPLGMLAHRLLVDNVGVVVFPEPMKDVWHAPQPAALALAGVTIAVLGALVPARSAARLTIATALHNE